MTIDDLRLHIYTLKEDSEDIKEDLENKNDDVLHSFYHGRIAVLKELLSYIERNT